VAALGRSAEKNHAFSKILGRVVYNWVTLIKEFKMTNLVEDHVERLFSGIAAQHGELCMNPVTGGWFVFGDDPTEPQMRMAHQALLAREWFAATGPHDAPPLPLSGAEMESLRYQGNALWHIIGHFAQSLRLQDWDYTRHPGFEDFARGVLASETAPDFVLEDEALRRRYPPRPLAGLSPFFMWKPPALRARRNQALRAHQRRHAS
jgi:hypothetical protein